MQSRVTIGIRVTAAALAAQLAAVGVHAQTPASPTSRLTAITNREPFDRAQWGIAALDVATGQVLYEQNAHKLFIPASALKLVVSATAAHRLDPAFRYSTTLAANGTLGAGSLSGDLVVRANGDPTLSGRYYTAMTTPFEMMADSLIARGILSVTGGIVVDESGWDEQYVHGDWESYDVLWWYAAPVAPFGFNDNAIDFRITAGAPGQPARITWEPQTSFFVLRNATRTVAAGMQRTVDFDRVAGTDTIVAYGQIPAGADPRTENFAVHDAARYAGTVLREVLERKGISVAREDVLVIQEPRPATLLFTFHSPPLDSIFAPILQRSQNWFAEQLLKTLAVEAGETGSWSAGLQLERQFLLEVVGLTEREFHLRDASGLSAGNLMTPAALARLVAYITNTPRQRTVKQALPAAGAANGSLRARLTDMGGRVNAKTGSIRNVASLAGLLTAASGRQIAFAIIANGTALPASRTNQAIDDVVRALAAAH